jgi:hypothetical protein
MFLLRVVETFNKQKVNYALVGGFAVALHGAVRGTVDLDFVIRIRESDFLGVEEAMKSLGLQSRLPVVAEEVFKFREEYIRNKNLTAWSFTNPNNPTEIVDIIITEDLKDLKTIVKIVAGQPILVADIPSLIAMKKKSNRPQDVEDIKALEALNS